MKKIFIATIFLALATAVSAGNNSEYSADNVDVRAGWSVGGTMPVGMPASIRSLNEYKLQPNYQIGIDYEHQFCKRWGIGLGVRQEHKSMETDAQVKGYHMTMVRGGESIEGYFNGNVVTSASMTQLTMPLQVTFHASQKVKIKAGPYASLVLDKGFDGYAYDGYIRKDSPVGPRIDVGSTEEERGVYDFHDDLRNASVGIDLGVDWLFFNNFGVYADLTWGLNGVFRKSFNTIEQTMYPIYGTVGVVYSIGKK